MNNATATRRKRPETLIAERTPQNESFAEFDQMMQDELNDHVETSMQILADQKVIAIPLDRLQRHPRNRHISIDDPDVIDLAAAIARDGQLEPLRVRSIGDERYQIISGERRSIAIRRNSMSHARCIVVELDDATALKEVAAANGHRKDLNPIERAEMMQDLMKPIEKGGSGLTLEQAGALFGLTSESGCKNAVRLLRLPTAIREQLVDGRLPERHARALIPYAGAEALMNEVVNDLKSDGYERTDLMSSFESDDLAGWMKGILEQNARPISGDLERWHHYPIGIRAACLFDWKAHESKLQIIEVPTELDYDSKSKRHPVEPRKWAFNTKLWDKLQEPLAKKRAEEGSRQPKGTKDTKSKGKPEKKLTPKEQAALDKKRAAKAEKRLDTFTKDWMCRMLRCTLAGLSNDDALVCVTLPWILGHCGQSDIRHAHEQALLECQVTTKRTRDALAILPKAKANDAYDVLCALWRVLLWPVTRLIGDAARQTDLAAAGMLPDKLISLGYQDELKNLQQLLAMTKVSMETAWRAGTVDDSDERRLISVWLCRHTKAQLHKLCTELGVAPGTNMNRDELAGCVLAQHRPGKPLRLPKRLGGAK